MEDSLKGKGKAAGKVGVAPPMRKAAEGSRNITMAQYSLGRDVGEERETSGSASGKGKGKAKEGEFSSILTCRISHSKQKLICRRC